MFCAPNQQNLSGIYKMAQKFRAVEVQNSRGGRSLNILIIPARIAYDESEFLNEFQQEFLQRFVEFTPNEFGLSIDRLWQLAIPYVPRYAYREIIAVQEKSKASAKEMVEAFNQLVFAISRFAPDGSTIWGAFPETKIQIGDATIVGSKVGRDIVVAGDTNIVHYHSPDVPLTTSLDLTTALNRYLGHVIKANRRLQLQGIRSAGQLVSIELEQAYVSLTATKRQHVAVEEEGWLVEAANPAPGEGRRRATQPRNTTIVVNMQQALADYPRLVVVGDPGSGKTTLLRYLTLTYARDLAGEDGLVKQRLNLDEQRLPILLPIREFARYLTTNHPDASLDGPKLLLDYLRTYFANQDIPLPERLFADRLQAGKCAVLLDGMDEVANLETRHRIARIIERFTIAYPDNRTVVTSRLVGYSGSTRLGEEYVVTRCQERW
jgi:hypothetical protein